jgi:hypothetical protein
LDDNFEIVLENPALTPPNIRHIFKDLVDIPGMRVMIKVNSGPGRSDLKFLAWRRTHEVIVYPGVPITTAVSQEMDQAYGGIKTG